jgi:Flp pilus assembly protein TadD
MKHRGKTVLGGSDPRFQEAAACLQRGDPAGAQTLAKRILAGNPDHPDANHLLGLIAFQAGRFELAIQLIGRAIQGNPHQVRYYHDLGMAQHKAGQIEKALDSCDQALKLKPRDAYMHGNRSLLLRELGRLDDALSAADHAIKLMQPEFADAVVFSRTAQAHARYFLG